jgi:hypothetical protein
MVPEVCLVKIQSFFNVLFPVLAGFLVLAAGACAPPVGGEGGNLTVVLGGDGSRAFSDITRDLSYKLDFSGPGGDTFTLPAARGTGSLTVSVSLGQWAIRLRAYTPEGVLYGLGEATVFVEGGKTNTVEITVHFAPTWYVAPRGENGADNQSTGSKEAPFASVEEALDAISEAYRKYNNDWPWDNDNDTNFQLPARILVSGIITRTENDNNSNGMVEIENTGSDTAYPPIILAGGESGGTLDAGDFGRVLYIDNADVTLGPGLTLTGGKAESGGGVYLKGGKFTMTGGTISRNAAASGGGVYVGWAESDVEGEFTMSGGIISDNTAEAQTEAADTGAYA